MTGTKRRCSKGHIYFKSSVPIAIGSPVCEATKKPAGDFLSSLSAPARRALENAGIKTVKQLSSYSEKEILRLHGMGKASLPVLRGALKESGSFFKN